MLASAEIILKTNDVVFTEVGSSLHFDKNEVFVARVFNAMRRSDRDVDRLSGDDCEVAIVKRDFGGSFDDEPMLGTLRMFLVAESLARQNLDAFDLERASLFQHGVTSPGSLIEFSHLD